MRPTSPTTELPPTDKGYINQRAGLARRAALVPRLYADAPADAVILLAP